MHDPTDATDDGRTDTDAPTDDRPAGWRTDGNPDDPPTVHVVPVRTADGTERALYQPTDGSEAAWAQADRSDLVDLEAHR